MGHKCVFIDRTEIYNNKPCRIVRAFYENLKGTKNFEEDVIREYIDGECEMSDHLYYSYQCGWIVSFTGENNRIYYYSYKVEKPYWSKINKKYMPNLSISYSDKVDIDMLIKYDDSLKYLLLKIDKNIKLSVLFSLIQHYKKYSNIETLCQKGLYRLALNTNLQRLGKKKLNQVINFIKDNPGVNENTLLKDIQVCIKNNIRYEDYDKFIFSDGDVELFKYLKNKKIDISYYCDYISMCKKAGHDVDDPYWKFPNDIYKAHNKVMEQIKNIELSNGKIRDGLLLEVTKNMAKYDSIVDGYRIFIPNKFSDIEKQCDILYQCLIRNNYVNKMINQEEVLVFIWKDGNPIATAQVFYDTKEVGQFYGDERGHNQGSDCKPSQEVEAAFYKWLKNVEIKKRKFSHKKKYYKGFYRKDGDYLIGYNNYHFKVGETYETYADDDEILKIGSDCVSTDKVFHFCDNINEIFRHYSPNEGLFVEVKPLGPIVENDGALLSNKIKILRQLSLEEIKELRSV